MPSRSHNRSSVHAPPGQREATISTTVLAVLQAVWAVFRARFAAWVLLRKRGHSVVVGAGPAALVLARRLAATRPKVLAILGP